MKQKAGKYPMRDLIIAVPILALLIWAFSYAPKEDNPKNDTEMYFSTYSETASPTSGEAVSFGAEMPEPLAPEKQSIENNPSDKRPETSEPATPEPTKTIDELAWEVIIGLWDCTETRWQMLTDAGYDAQAVQNRVNEILKEEYNMPYSDAYAQSLLNYTFAKTEKLTAPTSVYIGLCSNDPEADGGTFRELSGGGYSRVLISRAGETYPNLISSASGRAITNAYQINWTKATLDWALVNGFGLFTAATGGTPFFYGKLELTEEQKAAGGLEVVAGAVCLFDPQTLKISFPTTDVVENTTT